MNALFGELLPMILGNVLAPIWLIIVLLLLASPGGLLKAAAFVLGMTFIRVAQGLLFGALLAASSDDAAGESGLVAATLKLILGILLLIASFKKWRKEEDPDEPPPKWIQSLDQTTALKAFGLGALGIAIGPKLWAFTLSALAIINGAEIDQTSAIIAYAAYIFFAQILLILAVLFVAVAPKRSRAFLQRATAWLTTYNRPISITAALVFGLLFTWDGVNGFLNR
ncbi:GAP family protein [Candidatus Chloroploca sp. M-50]|uniref:GAP family protein n=1 Tax=Candidatus Chloroploca mongolica TaxID=2528176 RepID=A0ABS4DCR7_9CHLR|nr:GAP family protein [Candidatus Chloroploca mongolica]MBP1467224.1 GAP family protein [Candidatus Chloroploca mongolica]